ncbi:hypothetical protein QL285_020768 [Trifolium repens]|nr:hypothetical protein QL285_020768 [Trifolium repens]
MARNLLAMASKLVKTSCTISPWREICSPWRVNWFWPKSTREAGKRSPWRVSSAQKLLTRRGELLQKTLCFANFDNFTKNSLTILF